jgi:hypothetical protein
LTVILRPQCEPSIKFRSVQQHRKQQPLTQAPVWPACASEWGRGAGFKLRVAERLESWFESKPDLKETLENIIGSLWEQSVISPLLRLVEETAPEGEAAAGNVVRFPRRLSA